MKIKTAGVLGAATLLAGAGVAQAMPVAPNDLARVMNPTSYAELLQPIPNAAELLSVSNAEAAQLPLAREGDAGVEQAQFYDHHHHHHHFRGGFRGPFFHHHHHGYYRRFYHHHHHHHHFRRDYY